jgi:hypothetical protein
MKTKKKKNIIAIGGCFITTLLLQIYSIELVHVNIMFPIGLGIIALIMGYIFMDAIRKNIEQERKDDKFYLDHSISHESEKWLERYTELLNTQKASYTATKKNTEYQMRQFEVVLSRLEALEKNQATALTKVLELQKKALEGQKKALNIEITNSKENVNKIVELLQEGPKQEEVLEDQFSKLLSLEESNQKLFQDQLMRLVEIKDHLEVVEKVISQTPAPQKVFIDDYYQEDPLSVSEEEVNSLDSFMNEIAQEDEYLRDEDVSEEPLREDYLLDIASMEDEILMEDEISMEDKISIEDKILMEDKVLMEDEISMEETIFMGDEWSETDNHIELPVEEESKENASEADRIFEEPELEAVNSSNEIVAESKVVPLYDDPNKALTADEIAKLFASFGQ